MVESGQGAAQAGSAGRRLDLSRNQVVGSLAIVSVVALWVIVAPFANVLVKGENPFEAGVPYSVGGGATIVPAEGWSLAPGSGTGIFNVLTKGGATLTVVPAVESATSIEESLQTSIDGLRDDPSGTHWEVGDIETFQTEAGVPGGSVSGQSTHDVATTWVVSDGVRSITALGSVSESIWPDLGPEMDTMVRSTMLDALPSDAEEPAP